MRRYAFVKKAASVALAISGGAGHFLLNRLPELYAGLQRERARFPVQWACAATQNETSNASPEAADAPSHVQRSGNLPRR
jgi:hypothetical protein